MAIILRLAPAFCQLRGAGDDARETKYETSDGGVATVRKCAQAKQRMEAHWCYRRLIGGSCGEKSWNSVCRMESVEVEAVSRFLRILGRQRDVIRTMPEKVDNRIIETFI